MSNNNIKALKSSAWYIVANFLTAASAFLTTPIFTRLLTQEQYGMYNNFTSWQSILAILFTFNVQASLISARYDYEKDLNRYIFSTLSMSTASVLLCTLVLNLFSDAATDAMGITDAIKEELTDFAYILVDRLEESDLLEKLIKASKADDDQKQEDKLFERASKNPDFMDALLGQVGEHDNG